MKHIKGLDTLRAFAVIFVIITHWGPPFDTSAPAGKFIFTVLLPNGNDSVYVFFVLSGFLITSILLKARIENKEQNKLSIVKNFIVRRALRIFPIYYITLFILYFCYPDVQQHFWSLATYTLNILSFSKNSFMSAFSHSWTLSIEEQFYLVWPWAILFINTKYLRNLFIGVIAAGVVSTCINMGITQHIEPFLVTDCLDAFAIGGLYAWVLLNNKQVKFDSIIKKIVPFFILVRIYWNVVIPLNQPQYGMFLVKSVDSVISIWLIMLIINNKSEGVRKYLLENKFLNFIGRISYGIYIFHPFIVNINNPLKIFIDDRIVHNPFWHDFFVSFYFIYCLQFAILIFVSWASYKFIELPFLSFKKLFRYNSQAA